MKKSLLKLEDLKVGDRVCTYQLDNIIGITILISNTKILDDGSTEGTIEFIGKDRTTEMKKVFDACRKRDGRRPMIHINTYLENGAYSL